MTSAELIAEMREAIDAIDERMRAQHYTHISWHEIKKFNQILPMYWLRRWDSGDRSIDQDDWQKLKEDFDKGVAKTIAFKLTGSHL